MLWVVLKMDLQRFAAKSLRDAAKLEGHPERIGMTVYVNGLKKANYGLPGIRGIDAFKVEE